jgi:hypothetical protein
MVSPDGWPPDFRVDGHQVSGGGLVQRDHPLAGEGFGESVAVAFGEDEVGVVQKPVDGGGGYLTAKSWA